MGRERSNLQRMQTGREALDQLQFAYKSRLDGGAEPILPSINTLLTFNLKKRPHTRAFIGLGVLDELQRNYQNKDFAGLKGAMDVARSIKMHKQGPRTAERLREYESILASQSPTAEPETPTATAPVEPPVPVEPAPATTPAETEADVPKPVEEAKPTPKKGVLEKVPENFWLSPIERMRLRINEPFYRRSGSRFSPATDTDPLALIINPNDGKRVFPEVANPTIRRISEKLTSNEQDRDKLWRLFTYLNDQVITPEHFRAWLSTQNSQVEPLGHKPWSSIDEFADRDMTKPRDAVIPRQPKRPPFRMLEYTGPRRDRVYSADLTERLWLGDPNIPQSGRISELRRAVATGELEKHHYAWAEFLSHMVNRQRLIKLISDKSQEEQLHPSAAAAD